MGAGEFHGRVRDGIGCRLPAMATRSSNPPFGVVNGVWRLFFLHRPLAAPPAPRADEVKDACERRLALSYLFFARRVG